MIGDGRTLLRGTSESPWWHDTGMLSHYLCALDYLGAPSKYELISAVENAHRVSRAEAQGTINAYLAEADAA